jgi:ATP-dependent HslUV protease, peptidase subunit HslV
VADTERLLLLTGTGDVLEPEGGVAAVGSGSGFAIAAARALIGATDLPASEVVRRAMAVAAEICIYTNDSIRVVTLGEEDSR